MGRKKKRIFGKFRMDEISPVDVPAQEGAVISIMKRRQSGEPPQRVSKRSAMTDAVDGHSHTVLLDFGDGERTSGSTSYGYMPGVDNEYGNGHTHPWLMDEEGNITIGESSGHTHTIQTFSKQAGSADQSADTSTAGNIGKREDHMSDTNTTTAEDASAERISKLEKDLAFAKSFGELTDDQKDHYSKLGEDEKKSFISKSADERQAEIDELKKADEVVYKSLDGTVFRKSDDERLVKMAKRADDNERAFRKAEQERKDIEFAKRAKDEFGNLPGDESTHVEIVKALDSITDGEARQKAFEVLKSASSTFVKAFERVGTSDTESAEGDTPEARLNKMAKDYEKEHKVSFAKAYQAVCETEEGQQLYSELIN